MSSCFPRGTKTKFTRQDRPSQTGPIQSRVGAVDPICFSACPAAISLETTVCSPEDKVISSQSAEKLVRSCGFSVYHRPVTRLSGGKLDPKLNSQNPFIGRTIPRCPFGCPSRVHMSYTVRTRDGHEGGYFEFLSNYHYVPTQAGPEADSMSESIGVRL